MKNEGNINRVSEISKIHRLHGFFLLQPTVDLSTKIFRKHLKLYIIQPINVISASIWFKKLHHKGIRLHNVCVQWVFTITYFPILIKFWLFIVFNVNTESFIWYWITWFDCFNFSFCGYLNNIIWINFLSWLIGGFRLSSLFYTTSGFLICCPKLR